MSGNPKLAGICAVSLSGGYFASTVQAPPTDLTFLAVGQGDCTVFRHAGATVLIDAGPATPRFDAGDRIIAPTLRKMGVKHVDIVLLTHPDADHVGGLVGLAKRKRVGKVALPLHFKGHPQVATLLAKIRLLEKDVLWVSDRDELKIGAATLNIRMPKYIETESDNEGSMFVKLRVGNGSAVFTGDASVHTEARVSGRYEWRAQLLKAGHHGSRTSTGDAMLSAVSPEAVIISCGRNNSYGHPHQEVLDRLGQSGVKALRTDREGHIRFKLTRRGFERD
jgi:competence protein ComEC